MPEEVEKPDGQEPQHKHKIRDWWDKLDIISKFVTAGIVTLLTIIGTAYLNKQQDATRSTQLYSQFMSEREKAENQVRKDMFEKVLAEFWHKPSKDSCILDEVDQQTLELELISRNFHETLDLSPLFSHVLLKIVRNINTAKLKFPEEAIEQLGTPGKKPIKFRDSCSRKAYRRLLRGNQALFEKELTNLNIEKYSDAFVSWQGKYCRKRATKRCKKEYIIRQYIRDLKNYKKQKLVNIARRITAKQMESLSDVVQRIRLHVDLKNTCVDTKPRHRFIDSETCYEFLDPNRGVGNLINTYARANLAMEYDPKEYNQCQLEYEVERLVDGKTVHGKESVEGIKLSLTGEDGSRVNRCINFAVSRSYPRWNNIFVEVRTNRTAQERKSDRHGRPINKAGFWVSFFDFPLADNTYLSNRERFAVVLESLDEEARTAELSLLYFPASYAGFKEKAFFQQRMLNTLIKHN